jgi:tetratricopeptide (TPR) repeat protein
MRRVFSVFLFVVVGLSSGLGSRAWSQEMYTVHAEAAHKKARAAYNEERFEEAAVDFLLAAQIDPGAAWLKGAPYRDLGRSLFWLGSYDKAVFWYDVYLKGWPESEDREGVQKERAAANDRRGEPKRKVKVEEVYDRSLLELVGTLRDRVERKEPALTAEGGGTTRLYFQAVQQGYAMPELDALSRSLRSKLLEEIEGRWSAPAGAPMPLIGSEGEAPEVSRKRLASLRSLAPSKEELAQIDAWQRLLDAWGDFEAERYDQASGAMLDAARGLPKLGYLRYAAALCLLRANRTDEAISTLEAAAPEADAGVRPYYLLLKAEAQRLQDQPERAAESLWEVLTRRP